MQQKTFIKIFPVVFWLAVAVMIGARSLHAQKQQTEKKSMPADHANTNTARPDKQVSDLTADAASKLPHFPGRQLPVYLLPLGLSWLRQWVSKLSENSAGAVNG